MWTRQTSFFVTFFHSNLRVSNLNFPPHNTIYLRYLKYNFVETLTRSIPENQHYVLKLQRQKHSRVQLLNKENFNFQLSGMLNIQSELFPVF